LALLSLAGNYRANLAYQICLGAGLGRFCVALSCHGPVSLSTHTPTGVHFNEVIFIILTSDELVYTVFREGSQQTRGIKTPLLEGVALT
jgi:hypothetical protein